MTFWGTVGAFVLGSVIVAVLGWGVFLVRNRWRVCRNVNPEYKPIFAPGPPRVTRRQALRLFFGCGV